MKLSRPLTALAVMLCALPLPGCLGLAQERILPDPRIPHQVAERTEATVWCRRPDGSLVKQVVRLEEGWWIASPAVVQ